MANGWVVGLEDLIKLLLACAVGGLIGAERELSHKTAGLRTIILISAGSTLFTIFSLRLGGDTDPGRIAAGIVTGVGFIGAGVILHQGGEVRGLTTASTIWIAAALGMGIGAGYLLFACIATGVVLIVLAVLPVFERQIAESRGKQRYKLVCPLGEEKVTQLQSLFRQFGLKAQLQSQEKREGKITYTWEVTGPSEGHHKMVAALMADPEVVELQI